MNNNINFQIIGKYKILIKIGRKIKKNTEEITKIVKLIKKNILFINHNILYRKLN
jgi:hypothetical protein